MELATPRLRLREWRESDKSAIFLHINASASVMRYFPHHLPAQKAMQWLIHCVINLFSKMVGDFWAVELKRLKSLLALLD